MESQLAAFHNSRADSSEKSAENSALPVDSRAPRRNSLALQLAADLARQVGMVRTWPNLQTIRLAIESEAEHSGITVKHAAALIAMAANEFSRCGDGVTFPDSLDRYVAFKENTVDRFWFEDARWRSKGSYLEFLSRLEAGA